MEVFLKNSTLTNQKEDNKQDNNLIEQQKNNDEEINITKSKQAINFNKNNNEIKMEENYIIKIENKDNKDDKIHNSNEDKNLIKSDLLNIKTKNLNEKNIIERTEENVKKSLNLKTSMKSQFILKKILSNLAQKTKLFLIKYNKYYQKLMRINIDDYKKLSGKIKICGINGYGKEYKLNTLDLIFKGYYINGKKNGKGKEYDGDKIFESEYANGIKNGKGIEYNKKGILFEGEYLNGKRWNGILKEYFNSPHQIKFFGHYCEGKKIGKEYDIDGQLIFEGKYLNDKKWDGIICNNNGYLFPLKNGNGKVKEYGINGKLIFVGEYINGEKNGTEYDKESGLVIFKDEYLNGKKWNGKITEDIKETKYDEDTLIYYKLMIKEKNIKKQLKNCKNFFKI